MHEEPTIRPATLGDAGAIGTLHARSWKHAYRGILPDAVLDAITVEAWVERRRKALGTAPARADDLGPETIELLAIYLDPEDVGRSYGRRLIEHALADGVEQGFAEMTMWVLAGNERAQRYYRKAGFVPDERVEPEEFGDTGSLKLRMRRSLP